VQRRFALGSLALKFSSLAIGVVAFSLEAIAVDSITFTAEVDEYHLMAETEFSGGENESSLKAQYQRSKKTRILP